MSLIQRENRVGFRRAINWGEAVEPSTGDGLFVKTFSPPKGGRKIVNNEDEFGRGMATSGEVLEYEDQTGSMSLRVYYEGLETIIVSLMGKYSHSIPGGGVSKHKFTWAQTLDSILNTLAWDEGDEIKCVRTAKITSGTFSYQDGLNLDVNYQGDKLSISGWSTPLGVTYPSEGKGIFKLLNCTVQVNDFSAGDFQEGDKLNPSGIDLAITRGFESLPVTAGNDYAEEPMEKGAPTAEITLSFPKKETETAAYLNAFYNREYKKMSIKFLGEIIGAGPYSYELEFNFPKLFIMEAPDFNQDTPIPTTIKLKVLKADVQPTGMEEIVPYIFLQNEVPALTGYPA
jgi:hypothetical protein